MEICKVENCDKPVRTKGYCNKHYQQILKHGEIQKKPQKRICKIEGCNSIHLAGGYCNKHWQQMSKFGRIRERTIKDPNEFVFDGDICRIKLYNAKSIEAAEAIIDIEDYSKCKGRKWYLTGKGYVVSGNSKCVLYLQHLIFGRKTQVDHRDTNKLNNRKNNLRSCTAAENSRNCKISKNNTSGYKGVSWNKVQKKWSADITYNRKHIFLGYYMDVIQAADVYNKKAIELHKEYARLNVV